MIRNDLCSARGLGYEFEEEEVTPPEGEGGGKDCGGPDLEGAKKKKTGTAIKNYDLTRRYQLEWAAKLPWSEGVLAQDDIVHQVKCVSCSTPFSCNLASTRWRSISGAKSTRKTSCSLVASALPPF